MPESTNVPDTTFTIAPDGLHRAAGDVDRAAAELRRALDEIVGAFDEVAGSWSGTAQQWFANACIAWERSANELYASALAMAAQLRLAASAYEQAEADVARMFGAVVPEPAGSVDPAPVDVADAELVHPAAGPDAGGTWDEGATPATQHAEAAPTTGTTAGTGLAHEALAADALAGDTPSGGRGDEVAGDTPDRKMHDAEALDTDSVLASAFAPGTGPFAGLGPEPETPAGAGTGGAGSGNGDGWPPTYR